MKTLESILQGFPCTVTGPRDIAIRDIVFDSRQVTPGALFVALRGAHQDGHDHIQAALKAGARAIVAEREVAHHGATLVRVDNAFKALAQISSPFWDHPSRKLRMFGITGTN